MKKVRFGIVGIGAIGSHHANQITAAKDKDFELAAVCDIVPQRAAEAGAKYKVPHFTHGYDMFTSGLVDAVIIATPHYWHAPLTIKAAQSGLHVLCEKPLAVTVGPAREAIRQCKKHKVALGVMFMQRTRGIMMKMQQMVRKGELGEVFRVSMICSNWLRTQQYYKSGAWRGTWDGEGGGVIMNQAPHSLDLFQWIGGLPSKVIASVDTRWHKIEVENTVNAVCEYGNGRIGYIYATTAEAPGTEQFMLCGDKGTLVAEGGKLRFGRLPGSLRKHLMTTPGLYDLPECNWEDVAWKVEPNGEHINVVRAFARHVLRGTPMICTGAEGLSELELSNAIYLAGFKNKPVTLPVDADEIDSLIRSLEKQRSTGKGGNLRTAAQKELKRLLS